jgi:hypothetical protein
MDHRIMTAGGLGTLEGWVVAADYGAVGLYAVEILSLGTT